MIHRCEFRMPASADEYSTWPVSISSELDTQSATTLGIHSLLV